MGRVDQGEVRIAEIRRFMIGSATRPWRITKAVVVRTVTAVATANQSGVS